MLLFGLFAASVLLCVHLYFWRRLSWPLKRRSARLAVLFACLFSWAVSGLGMALARIFPSEATHLLQRASYALLIPALYLFLALGTSDVLWLIFRAVRALLRKISERKTPSKSPAQPPPESDNPSVPMDPSRRRFLLASGASSVGLAFAASGAGALSAFDCPVRRVDIRLEKLPASMDGFTLALLSDIHAGGWIGRGFIQRLVEGVNAMNADAVLICGDLVDGGVDELKSEVAPLKGLTSRFGTFFTIGNHELYSGAEAWCAFLPSLGIRVLRNERVELGGIDLLGVDDWTARRAGILPGYSLEGVLSSRRREAPAILMTHQPRGFQAAAARGIDLQLSGHTHGGQVFPFQSIARRANEGYLAGLYREGKSQIYVTRGCGFWGPPVRLLAPAELTRIVLHPGTHD